MDPVNKIIGKKSPWTLYGRELRQIDEVNYKGYTIILEAGDPSGINWTIVKADNPNGGSYDMGMGKYVVEAVNKAKKKIDSNKTKWDRY